MAYEFAEANGIQHSFDGVSRLAGRDWVYGFLKRNGTLPLKTPEAISLGRAIGFNEPQWNIYQDNLKEMFEKFHFLPGRMYNMMRVVLVQCQINSGKSLVRKVVM
jgi:hypothetical protein